MKIASWNVNSLRARLDHVLKWLIEVKPDILALQEIKMDNHQFPEDAFKAIGYRATWSGQKTYNGVAVLSRDISGEAVERVLPCLSEDPQKRLLAATFKDIRIINVYVPNGESLDSEKFPYKLEWLAGLHGYVQAQLTKYPKLIVLGDFNIAPEDRDVHAPGAWQGKVLTSPVERQAFQDLLALGLKDTHRLFEYDQPIYSWWDYRAGSFRANRGLRIDHIVASKPLCKICQQSSIDVEPRTWEKPSDHAPAIAQFKA